LCSTESENKDVATAGPIALAVDAVVCERPLTAPSERLLGVDAVIYMKMHANKMSFRIYAYSKGESQTIGHVHKCHHDEYHPNQDPDKNCHSKSLSVNTHDRERNKHDKVRPYSNDEDRPFTQMPNDSTETEYLKQANKDTARAENITNERRCEVQTAQLNGHRKEKR
jgi:hypothetical protein